MVFYHHDLFTNRWALYKSFDILKCSHYYFATTHTVIHKLLLFKSKPLLLVQTCSWIHWLKLFSRLGFINTFTFYNIIFCSAIRRGSKSSVDVKSTWTESPLVMQSLVLKVISVHKLCMYYTFVILYLKKRFYFFLVDAIEWSLFSSTYEYHNMCYSYYFINKVFACFLTYL